MREIMYFTYELVDWVFPDEEGVGREKNKVDPENSETSSEPRTDATAEIEAMKGINPGTGSNDRTMNCLNCAFSAEHTLSGHPTTAMPSESGAPVNILEEKFGGSFEWKENLNHIEKDLLLVTTLLLPHSQPN